MLGASSAGVAIIASSSASVRSPSSCGWSVEECTAEMGIYGGDAKKEVGKTR